MFIITNNNTGMGLNFEEVDVWAMVIGGLL